MSCTKEIKTKQKQKENCKMMRGVWSRHCQSDSL
jgi:hypothetical protein